MCAVLFCVSSFVSSDLFIRMIFPNCTAHSTPASKNSVIAKIKAKRALTREAVAEHI